jgi:hypothetical protein
MTIKDEIKMEIIDYIDKIQVNYKGYTKEYSKELKKFRDKYIYKDIEYNECKNDVDTINHIKRQVELSKIFWEEL